MTSESSKSCNLLFIKIVIDIYSHTRDGSLNLLIYHGDSRNLTPEAIATGFDVVCTTYKTLTQEYHGGPDGILHRIAWKRIILDEGMSQKHDAL